MSEISLRIDGMHCGACIRRVTQSLQSIPGVEVEEVRLGAARVRVADGESHAPADPDALISGLNKAGFAAHQE